MACQESMVSVALLLQLAFGLCVPVTLRQRHISVWLMLSAEPTAAAATLYFFFAYVSFFPGTFLPTFRGTKNAQGHQDGVCDVVAGVNASNPLSDAGRGRKRERAPVRRPTSEGSGFNEHCIYRFVESKSLIQTGHGAQSLVAACLITPALSYPRACTQQQLEWTRVLVWAAQPGSASYR